MTHIIIIFEPPKINEKNDISPDCFHFVWTHEARLLLLCASFFIMLGWFSYGQITQYNLRKFTHLIWIKFKWTVDTSKNI